MIEVSDEVCKRLGKSRDEIAKMTIMRFAYLCFSKGLVPRVLPIKDAAPNDGGVTIQMGHETDTRSMG